MEFATIAAAQRLALRALVKLTAFCWHRGRARRHLWCTTDAFALSRALYAGTQVLFCSAMTLGS
jgi:hypothetical protein